MSEPQKTKNNYIDNKQFYRAICEYKELAAQYKREGKTKPPLTNYIGECFQLIAKNVATKPNFSKYPYLDEMRSDGVENCVHYFDNYNHEKYSNPFAYFTQIIYYAFLRRIHKEKWQLYIKYKIMERSTIYDEVADQADHDDSYSLENHGLDNEKLIDIVKGIESWGAKRRVRKKKGLEKFIEENEDGEDKPYSANDDSGLGTELEGPEAFEDD
jgi:hypothetical protein